MSKKRVKHGEYDFKEFDELPNAVNCTPGKGWGSCHTTHPVLSLGGGQILGASCTQPRGKFDIYVGLDWGMKLREPAFPWNPKPEVIEVTFPIPDGGVPKDPKEFDKMVTWLAAQLALGKTIHVGCIGGHGRTGLLLAALVRVINNDTDASAWVRKHHCPSAIETPEQMKFLHDRYGITEVAPSKRKAKQEWAMSTPYAAYPTTTTVLRPVRGSSLWGPAIQMSLTNESKGL